MFEDGYMIKDLLMHCKSATLYINNASMPLTDWEQILDGILEYAYTAPSLKVVEPTSAHELTNNGVWIELDMGKEVSHEEYKFEKLIIPIKPKYNWLTCIRYYDGAYQGKCFNINLSTNTTQLYKYLSSLSI